MAIPADCPRCGSPMVAGQDTDTWFCEAGVDAYEDDPHACKYQYEPTRREIIDYLRESFPDPEPPADVPIFGVALPGDYTPKDWEKATRCLSIATRRKRNHE